MWSHSTSGENSLTAAEFKAVLSDYLPMNQLDVIYKKIDVNDDGNVDFSEFIDFLIASESGTNWSAALYSSKLVKQREQVLDCFSIWKRLFFTRLPIFSGR